MNPTQIITAVTDELPIDYDGHLVERLKRKLRSVLRDLPKDKQTITRQLERARARNRALKFRLRIATRGLNYAATKSKEPDIMDTCSRALRFANRGKGGAAYPPP